MLRWIPLLLVLVALAGLVLVAHELKVRSGVDFSGDLLAQLRAVIVSLGWVAPAVYVFVGAFRVFFFIPSWVLLTVAGLAFGAGLGALLGALGIVLSGALGFLLARFGGQGHLRDWIEIRYGSLQRRLERAGLALVGLVTAHPAVPMSGVHWAAGLTTLPFLGFCAAVALGATVRASTLAYLGASFTELGVTASVLIAAGLAVLCALPLLHPSMRARLLIRGEDDPAGPEDGRV
jgi:uncharacterized membrane protein YdjX (TVP38/TMEM64 family)